jgi:hypothetical protein
MDNKKNNTSFSMIQRWASGINAIVSALVLLVIVIMINFIAARHFVRIKLDPESTGKLSSMTLQILHSLTNTVDITVFYDTSEVSFSFIDSLLREYKSECPFLNIVTVDYVKNPGLAAMIKEKYRLTFPQTKNEVLFKNLVIFDCNNRVKAVYDKELWDYDLSDFLSGKESEIRRAAFKGEMLFTSALIVVSDNRVRNAYFVTGHGEHSPISQEANTGFKDFASILELNNIQVNLLNLTSTNRIPEDCNLLVIAGPVNRYLPEELNKINDYLKSGGRILILFRAGLHAGIYTGLESLLSEWGVNVGSDMIFDATATITGQDMQVTNFTLSHPIMKPLANSRLYVSLPRSISRKEQAKVDADAPIVEELAFSSKNGIAITDIRNGLGYPKPTDKRGELPLIASIEKGNVPGVTGDFALTRMVVCGDSYFLSNQIIDSLANRDFAVLAVNWLIDRPYTMGGIGPRPIGKYKLNLSRTQRNLVWITFAGVIPCSILFVSLLVWWNRRN